MRSATDILRALLTLEVAAGRLGDDEEEALFPVLIKAGVPAESGPIAVMLEEHAEGRALLATMLTGEPIHRAAAAHRYVRLLRDHIDKENEVLFPLADAVLDERDQAEVCREFADLDAQLGEAACPDLARDTLARLADAIEGGLPRWASTAGGLKGAP